MDSTQAEAHHLATLIVRVHISRVQAIRGIVRGM